MHPWSLNEFLKTTYLLSFRKIMISPSILFSTWYQYNALNRYKANFPLKKIASRVISLIFFHKLSFIHRQRLKLWIEVVFRKKTSFSIYYDSKTFQFLEYLIIYQIRSSRSLSLLLLLCSWCKEFKFNRYYPTTSKYPLRPLIIDISRNLLKYPLSQPYISDFIAIHIHHLNVHLTKPPRR